MGTASITFQQHYLLTALFLRSLFRMQVYGTFLTDAPASTASDVSITVGDLPCPITATSTTQTGVQLLGCAAPFLPAGTWPVAVLVAGRGAARTPLSSSRPTPSISYPFIPGSTIAPSMILGHCHGSVYGGGMLTVQGVGFVEGVTSMAFNRTMTAAWDFDWSVEWVWVWVWVWVPGVVVSSHTMAACCLHVHDFRHGSPI